jgi:hypothetical protein
MTGMRVLFFILMIDVSWDLHSWILTLCHSATGACCHDRFEATRQLRRQLEIFGVAHAGLLLAGGSIEWLCVCRHSIG